MVIRRRVEHGLIVLQGGATLLEGLAVEVIVHTEPTMSAELAEEQKRKRAVVMARLAAMPDENSDDRLNGSDHDQILYGEP